MKEVLSFTDFSDYIREHLQEDWWEDREIEIYKVTKNNGKELTAVLLPRDGSVITPTFYMEEFYRMYCGGCDLKELIPWIRDRYEEAEEAVVHVDANEITSYDYVKDRVTFRLINCEKNGELLAECPHILLHDLAVTFRVMVGFDHGAVASALVTYDQLKMWDVTMDEIFVRAEENTRRILPPRVYSMNDFLTSRGCVPLEEDDVMYVATNKCLMYGATVILYDGLLEQFSDFAGVSFYVIPSSVHEVLFIPDRPELDIDPGELLRMVWDVNSTCVELDDILSDSVYYYEKDTHRLISCDI